MSEFEPMEDSPISVIPEIPYWSENFALAGFCPGSGVDVFLHIGRWRKDLTLWREIVTIALPDGTVLAHRVWVCPDLVRKALEGPTSASTLSSNTAVNAGDF